MKNIKKEDCLYTDGRVSYDLGAYFYWDGDTLWHAAQLVNGDWETYTEDDKEINVKAGDVMWCETSSVELPEQQTLLDIINKKWNIHLTEDSFPGR